jgi:hypothetical protein
MCAIESDYLLEAAHQRRAIAQGWGIFPAFPAPSDDGCGRLGAVLAICVGGPSDH